MVYWSYCMKERKIVWNLESVGFQLNSTSIFVRYWNQLNFERLHLVDCPAILKNCFILSISILEKKFKSKILWNKEPAYQQIWKEVVILCFLRYYLFNMYIVKDIFNSCKYVRYFLFQKIKDFFIYSQNSFHTRAQESRW